MHPVRQIIETYAPLSDEDWAAIASRLAVEQLPKGAVLLQEGAVCRYVYFLESGLLRYYRLADGIEATKFFTVAPYCFTSQRSFTRQEPAAESIATLEESTVWRMSRQDAYALFDNQAWSTFVRELVQEVQYYTEQLLQAAQTQTAEDRYRALLEQNPDLLNRVSLKYLASYLGIAPQSISRIRKKVQETERSSHR